MSLLQKTIFLKLMRLHLVRHKWGVGQIINQGDKRASLLADMLKDRDKRKHWHFEILQNQTKAKNVFERVSKPSRRQKVLNSLFIKNITDVLSTGDVSPELLGFNFEITGVKVSPCCKVVNVYWQIPTNIEAEEKAEEEIATILNSVAPKIRAELISRNVLGRVPRIFFVRDATNSFMSAFEKAMKEIDLGPQNELNIIPDDAFVENVYKFNDSKANKEPKQPKVAEPPKVEAKKSNLPPKRPPDMKIDVFGLKHDELLSKVMAAKSKPASKHVITAPDWLEGADLFDRIPGTTLHGDSDREEMMKQFHIQRKMMKNRKPQWENRNEDTHFFDSRIDAVEPEMVGQEDFVEEETTERF